MNGRRIIKAFTRRLGFDLVQWSPRIGCERDALFAMAHLLDAATVRTIFDVGANIGQSVAAYLPLFPNAEIWSFEPFPQAFERLRSHHGGNPRVHLEQAAMSDAAGAATFQSNESDWTNSLLPTIPGGSAEAGLGEMMRTRDTIQVKTETLDGYCARAGIESIDLLKIDAQGATDLVLAGGRRLLAEKRVRMVYAEVEFFPMYEGQKCFPEVRATLERSGYVLYRLYNQRNPRGRLAWADAMFVLPDLLNRHLPS